MLQVIRLNLYSSMIETLGIKEFLLKFLHLPWSNFVVLISKTNHSTGAFFTLSFCFSYQKLNLICVFKECFEKFGRI